MQDPFTKYVDEKYELTKSYYDHHKLQPRSIKTKEMIRAKISSKSSSNEQSRNTLRMTKKSNENLEDFKINENKTKNTTTQTKLFLGRNLFQQQIKTHPHLGPGDYDPYLAKSNNFGYIQKDSPDKAIPSKKIKDRINQFIGPGRYAFQSSQKFLSRHRSLSGRTFASQNLVRCILSKEKSQNINLKILEQNDKKEVWMKKLGPGFYNIEKSEMKIDKFRKTLTFPVSMTERSSLVKMQKLPGPGYYDWQKNLSAKLEDKTRKPKIQFKFVH